MRFGPPVRISEPVKADAMRFGFFVVYRGYCRGLVPQYTMTISQV